MVTIAGPGRSPAKVIRRRMMTLNVFCLPAKPRPLRVPGKELIDLGLYEGDHAREMGGGLLVAAAD